MHLSKISLALRQWGNVDPNMDPNAAIKALFANNEQGVWYDYSDLTTMFQDRAGTTPVTADGQPVGLILDKSKGLVLGSELVTNGTFDTNTTGWTDVGATLSVVDGKINIAGNGFNTGAWQSITFEAGKRYQITLESFYSSASFAIILGNGFGQGQIFDTGSLSSSGTLEWNIVVGAGAKVLSLFCMTAGSVQFDNISVKEIPGNHSVAPNDSARPLYKTSGGLHWLQFDGVDDSVNTANVNFTATDKMTIFSGELRDAASGFQGIYEIIGPGFPGCAWEYTSGSTIESKARGTNSSITGIAGAVVANTKYVNTRKIDFAGATESDCLSYRSNGSVIGNGNAVIGGGSFDTGPIIIGSSTGVLLAGRVYSMIIRGAASTTQEITDTETWVNGKTGAY